MKINNVYQLLFLALTGFASAMAQNTSLTGFVDANPYEGVYIERVFYLNATSQQIQELYNYGFWSVQNPSLDASTPPAQLSSALTSFYDGFGIQHVFYVDNSFDVHELYNTGEQWFGNRLTQGATNGPRARDQYALTSCFDSHKVEHVFYIDLNGDIQELYNNGQWATDDASAQANSAAAASGSGLTSYCDPSGNPNVFYTDYAHRIRLLTHSTGKWVSGDLTLVTSGPAAAFANALTSFYDAFDIGHVFYFDTAGNVQELYNVRGSWYGNNLTAETKSPPVISGGGRGLTSFFDSFNVEHVFFVDSSNTVRELYNNGEWLTDDPGTLANAPAPAHASALASFFDTKGEHVFYVDTASHVIQLDYAGSAWQNTDLTSAATAPLATP